MSAGLATTFRENSQRLRDALACLLVLNKQVCEEIESPPRRHRIVASEVSTREPIIEQYQYRDRNLITELLNQSTNALSEVRTLADQCSHDVAAMLDDGTSPKTWHHRLTTPSNAINTATALLQRAQDGDVSVVRDVIKKLADLEEALPAMTQAMVSKGVATAPQVPACRIRVKPSGDDTLPAVGWLDDVRFDLHNRVAQFLEALIQNPGQRLAWRKYADPNRKDNDKWSVRRNTLPADVQVLFESKSGPLGGILLKQEAWR